MFESATSAPRFKAYAECTRSRDEGRGRKDDLRFKTREGNDIETDVTVRRRIDPSKAARVWQIVAPSTGAIRSRLVRPQARAYVGDVLNRLDSEEFYNPDLRFRAANDATKLLASHLALYGIIVEQVILKERMALNGSAGDAYVSLQRIDALQKKEIRRIPKLPNGNVIIDGNKLLQAARRGSCTAGTAERAQITDGDLKRPC